MNKNLVLSTELVMQIDHFTGILKAAVSNVSPSSESESGNYGLCVACIVEEELR